MIQELGKGKARLIVSFGSGDNRQRFCKTVTYKTKKELKQMYDAFEKECKNTEPTTDITVEELVDDYIAYCKALGRKPTTIRGYEIAVGRLQPSVERTLAKNCTTYQLEKQIAEMSSNGLSAKSIRNTIAVLSAAYRHAIKINQLKENPCENLTIPKGKPREIRILHMDEIQDFIFAIADCDLNEKVAYELALFLGLRRSEILGLKESDVDIVSGMVHIHNTRHRVDKEDYDSDTKTERSERTLALPDILLMDIARLLESHRQFPYEKTDYLIQDGFGNPLGGQALSTRLVRLEEEKKLPHVTLHGLRHTYASLLHASGVDMAQISAELGHSNLATTVNIYTHILKTPSQSSRGIASTINRITENGQKVAKIEDKKNPRNR